MTSILERALVAARSEPVVRLVGHVIRITGTIIEATGPAAALGTPVAIISGDLQLRGEIVGFQEDRVLLMPYGELYGVAPGATVLAGLEPIEVGIGPSYLGRVVNALGEPMDGGLSLDPEARVPLRRAPPSPVTRKKVCEPFDLGVRCINTLLTTGVGQRVGIMAGSGVGKSTLLGMVARHAKSEVNVIGLVGERGREVREFLERDLGPEGLARSVVVVATGDQSALLRVRAAYLATAYAEYFRAQGARVVLMIDSITRLAMAQREIGLAVGEPPSSRGYTPSVFSLLPRILERAGTCEGDGSITGLYTVLVEGDDMNEPIADTTRGILDGHVVLSRRLAGRGHFPAVEILESASRVMREILPPEAIDLAVQAREVLATYREVEDLLTIGAYKRGQNPRADRAVDLIEPLTQFLRQQAEQRVGMEESWLQLQQILG